MVQFGFLRRRLSRFILFLAVSGLAVPVAASAQVLSRPAPRIAEAITNAFPYTLPGSVHPLTRVYPNVGSADALRTIQGMTVFFKRSAAQQVALNTLLQQQQTPGSPEFHRWLTPAQFAAEFGLASSDVAAVTSWLEQQGFQVQQSSPLFVKFSGTVAQIQQTFNTQMEQYSVHGAIRLANSTPIQIPSALAGVVESVRGLSEFRPRPHVRHSASAHYDTGGGNYFVTPADLATIYDIQALYNAGYTGSGESIAVVGQSEILASDVANFRSAAGLPVNAPTMTLVPGSGTAAESSSDEEESDLDVEWSGAVAQKAAVNFIYVGNNQNYSVFDSLAYAIQNNVAPVITISYGACEAEWDSSEISSEESLFQQANAQGQTIVASAGDSGAADCDVSTGPSSVITQATQGLAVDYPGSSTYVTSIGGTEFSGDVNSPGSYWNSSNGTGGGSATRYIPEKVWNDTNTQLGLEAGGGGVSTLFGKPSWQTGTGVPADQHRDVPDISWNASPQHDGYLYCSTAADSTSCSNGFANASSDLDLAGGTSFGAPITAGILALINQKEQSSGQGNFNPAIYAAANSSYGTAFHDVTAGNNEVPCKASSPDCGSSGEIGYAATTGFDLASGWGSIDAYNFVNAVSSPTTTAPVSVATTVNLTAQSNTPAVNASDAFTAVITPNSGTTAPAGTVQFQVDGANVGSAVSVSADTGAAADAVEATFSTTFTTAGQHTVTAVYSGGPTFTGSNGSLQVTAEAPSIGSASYQLSATNVTVAAGASGTSTITVTPSGGFTGTVTFTAGAPSTLANVCFLAVPSATVSGTSPASATLTIETTQRACASTGKDRALARVTAGGQPGSPFSQQLAGVEAAGVMLISLVMLGMPGRRRGLWLLVLIAGAAAGLTGCGTSTPAPLQANPGTYTLTVTGTDAAANLSQSTTFTLTIQ